jgi:predicted Zn-dependent peptidase
LNNLSGRFFLEVREKYGLTYRTFSEIELEETTGFFSVQCEMNPKYLLATFTIVIQILNGLVEGITSKELQAAQQQLHTNWVRDGEDNDALSKYNGEQLFLFSSNMLPHANLYEKYKVKKDDLNRIIHQYFVRKNFIVSIVSEKELNLLAVEKVGNGFRKISP